MTTKAKAMTFAAAIAGLALVPSVTKADIYYWHPDTTSPAPINGVTSSGQLNYDPNAFGNGITSFSFTYGSAGTDYYYSIFSGSLTLQNGDLVLIGTSSA